MVIPFSSNGGEATHMIWGTFWREIDKEEEGELGESHNFRYSLSKDNIGHFEKIIRTILGWM